MTRFYFVLPLILLASCAAQPAENPKLRAAKILLDHGGANSALHVAQSELMVDPSNKSALIIQAEAEYAERRYLQSEASFKKVLAIDPGNTRALTGLGRLNLNRDPATAEKLFRRAIKSDPENVDAKIDLGISLDNQRRFAEAQKIYREVISEMPESDRAMNNLGLSLALSGDTDQAIEILRPLNVGGAGTHRSRVNFAFVLMLAGRDDAAKSQLSQFMSPQEADRTYKTLSAHVTDIRGNSGH